MDHELTRKLARQYLADCLGDPAKEAEEEADRAERLALYAGWNYERMKNATLDDLVEFMAPLWSMAMWGDKPKRIGLIVADNGLQELRLGLAELLWGNQNLVERWDGFRNNYKWFGPSMMSELLGYVAPDSCIVWNKVVSNALAFLGFDSLPTQSYQVDGQAYQAICEAAAEISVVLTEELNRAARPVSLLEVNYFLWDQVSLEKAKLPTTDTDDVAKADSNLELSATPATEGKQAEFLHDDIKEKVAEIGRWLGFESSIEVKVSAGSVVDAVWESTIGNLGRVIYVFEVQTHGSIDSLILNLLKSKKNAAVQGVIAVSDAKQIQKIYAHAGDVEGLKLLRCWDYTDVLNTHERLQAVNESINGLQLVPDSFSSK